METKNLVAAIEAGSCAGLELNETILQPASY
jgi:hypothetical protein